ncbi:uncharacterized protein LOC100889002 [Strongylocentrotus purpuratus]|uniref:Uncharacterized protein n=1 Tax=Strongylocentrotus purpuratus TaxID=7668 RepID=A0A7M7PQU7_STRPU|nr:uncharacterized protein LOC100889002 [Strongylocentrotus purpuratus]
MTIRLDIWHLMRRLATGCSTDSHQLYSVFLGRLSACIFEWSGEDLRLLMEAKRAVLVGQHIFNPTDQDVISSISPKEMAQHCRRKTRGAEETTWLIRDLIAALDREQGLDTLRVPLFDHDRIWHEWDKQKNHMECIHDPDDISLYTKIGEMVKGGELVRVASTSKPTYWKEYLAGIKTAAQAISIRGSGPRVNTYSGLLRHAVNVLAEEILHMKIDPSFVAPQEYTGELIRVEYLYAQTNAVLGLTEPECMEEAVVVDEDFDEGFEDASEVEDLTQPGISATSASTRHSVRAAPPEDQQTSSLEHNVRKRPYGVNPAMETAGASLDSIMDESSSRCRHRQKVAPTPRVATTAPKVFIAIPTGTPPPPPPLPRFFTPRGAALAVQSGATPSPAEEVERHTPVGPMETTTPSPAEKQRSTSQEPGGPLAESARSFETTPHKVSTT